MLFDLRGRGRRRTVQVIYVTLALLLGGGLVLFGIGGDVQGGLFDAFRENRGSGADVIEDAAKKARAETRKNPQDARSWAVLAEREYQLAGVEEGFKAEDQNNPFQGKARERLVAAERAWDQHLKLAGDKPNQNAAGTMRQAFGPNALNKPDKAVRAQEIILDANPNPGDGDYALLAQMAYLAGQTRKGDLAAKRAEELAPTKSRKEEVKAALEAAKAQAATSAAGAATGGAAAPTPPPSGE